MDYNILYEKLYEKDYNHPIAEPYDEEEILQYEKHLGEKLPTDFRNYMIEFSREVFGNIYPVIVNDFVSNNGKCRYCKNDFDKDCTRDNFKIPIDLKYWIEANYYSSLKCPKCNNEYKYKCSNCDIGLYGGNIMIGNAGCSNNDILIIKGPHKGSVWSIEDSSGCKIASSFKEYMEKFDYFY